MLESVCMIELRAATQSSEAVSVISKQQDSVEKASSGRASRKELRHKVPSNSFQAPDKSHK